MGKRKFNQNFVEEANMKTTLHTVSYAGVWPGQAHLTLEETIDRAARLGFDAVTIMAKRPHLSVLDTSAKDLQALRQRMDDAGICLAVTAAYTNFGADAEHTDIPVNEYQIACITRLAEMTQVLGGTVIRVFTSYGNETLSHWQLWNRTVEALRECARRAAAYDCTIAVQNHHDLAGHWESMHHLLAEINEPNCKAAFDAWSVMLQGENEAEAARQMAPVTVCTTNADYTCLPRFKYRGDLVNYEVELPLSQMVPFGEGIIDYQGFFDGLKDGGYDGYLGFEMCAPLLGSGGLENLDRYARTFLEYVKPWTG